MQRMKTKTGARLRAGARQGSVLVMALVAVVTVSFLAATFLQVSSSVTKRQAAAVNRKQSFYMAEAGLAEAFAGVSQGKTGNVGTEAQPARFGEGLFWVEATDLGDGLVRLESTGMVGVGRAKLSFVVRRGSQEIPVQGVFSEQALTIPPGVFIDGYDSARGSYAEQLTERSIGGARVEEREGLLEKVGATLGKVVGLVAPTSQETIKADAKVTFASVSQVASNGAVTVQSESAQPTYVFAGITAGPDTGVRTEGDPFVMGELELADVPVELPAVEVPELAAEEPLVYDSGHARVLPSGWHAYEGLTISGGSDVVLEGPATYVIDVLNVASGSSLTLDATQGRIDLIVTDSLALDAGSVLATSLADPTQVSVKVAGSDPVQLAASGAFHGVVYAPEAEIQLASSLEVFGGLVGNQLGLGSGARVHFDQALIAAARDADLSEHVAWRIVELSTEGESGSDAFTILGVDPSTLVAPADAHQDQWLECDYVDGGGATRTYTGFESAFDWSAVRSISRLTRDGDSVDGGGSRGLLPGLIDALDSGTSDILSSPPSLLGP